MTLMLISVLSLLGAVVRAGEAPKWKEDWERTLQAARKEGQLVIYGSAEHEQLYAEFHKKFPEIKVTGVFGRGADVAQRIMAERRADKFVTDLYLSGHGTGYNVLYKGKAVDPIAPTLVLPEVTDTSKWWQRKHHYADPEDKYLFIFNGGTRVVVGYNTKLVNPSMIKSYWDLLDPKWKGKIVALDPNSVGSGDALRFFYYKRDLGREFISRLLTEMDAWVHGAEKHCH
jgi:iron(III) transport system substrate-binding protein